MEESLVFSLVWSYIHERYQKRKKSELSQLTTCLQDNFGTKTGEQREEIFERTMYGMMNLLEHFSYCLLKKYGYATPWYMKNEHISMFYPIRIQALDLPIPDVLPAYVPNSNPLGGYRV
jgi:hypothetical protein